MPSTDHYLLEEVGKLKSQIRGLRQTEVPYLGNGTAFPPNPTDGDVFYRTDVQTLYSYKSATSSWLTIGAGSTSGPVSSVSGTAPIGSSGGSAPVISHNTSGVTSGSYTNANITVDTYGHLTAAASGATAGIVNTVAGNSPLYTTGTTAITVFHDVSGTSAGSFTHANLSVNSQGHITSVSSGDMTATSPIVSSGGATPNLTHAPSGIVAATYNYPTQIIVDTYGHVTSVSGGSATPPAFDIQVGNNTGVTMPVCSAVNINPSGGLNYCRIADSGPTNDFPVSGFLTVALPNGSSTSMRVSGTLSGFTGLTSGVLYYSDPTTPGGITTSSTGASGTKLQKVGIAISTTVLFINIDQKRVKRF